MLFHKHMLIRGFLKNPPKESKALEDFFIELVSNIKMKVFIAPVAKYLDTEGNRGITGTVVIETSHMSMHVWDEQSPALMQMDVYSCKDFDEKVVIDTIDQHFGLLAYEHLSIDRNNGLKVI